MLNNTITSQVVNNNVVVVTSENTINVTQPITNVIEVATPGPQGPAGIVDTGSLLITASAALNIITFEKGDGSTFNITVDTGSGGINTNSFATTGSNTFIGNQIITGSVDITGSLTVNTINVGQNTLNFVDNNNVILTSLSVSGSTLILSTGSFSTPQGGLTGSLLGTASWAENVISSSYALTASYAMNGGGGTPIDTSSFIQNSQTSSMLAPYVLNSSTSSFVQNSQTSSFVTNSQTGSFVINSQTSSFIQNNQTSSFTTTSSFNAFTSSINGVTSSFLTTGSSNTTQTISGSLIIDQNLTVLGSSSITYVTSSQLNIGTNLITVNTATPAVRFGGLAVFDSGSTGTGLTGSILWDSQNNIWIYSNPSGASYDGAMILVGPRNSTGLGNEAGINSWYAAIGNGSHHMTSSVIWNSGSLIRLETNTQVTGSLDVLSGITGSLFGTSSWATNTLTASLAPNYVLNSATSSFIINSQTSSFVTNSQTSSMSVLSSSFATTASYAANAGVAFPYNGTATITGSLITSGSAARFINDVVITGSLIVSSSGTNVSNIIGGSTSGSRISFKATNITGVPTSVSNMFSFFSNNTTELLRIGDSLNGQVDTAIWGAGNNGSGNYAMRFGSTYCYINGSSDARIMINGASIIQCSSTTATMAQGITFSDAKNITFNATTGTKIGTATTEKLAFWNKTPIVQPTSSIAAATFVANTSGIANDTATFDGYTLGQVVRALRNAGLLA